MTDFELDRIVKLQGTNYDRRRKLSTADVTAIRRAYKSGKQIIDLANDYSVSYGTILYHVDTYFKRKINKSRKQYGQAPQDYIAQRKSRIALKRAILEGAV